MGSERAGLASAEGHRLRWIAAAEGEDAFAAGSADTEGVFLAGEFVGEEKVGEAESFRAGGCGDLEVQPEREC